MKPYISRNDEALLNSLGYKQELKREFSVFQLFSVAFSIMSLIPSIASVITYGLQAGGVGMSIGWLVASVFITVVGLSLSRLGSAYPTSGGLYYWTFQFAPEKVRKPASFLCAYANTLGLIGGLCSIDYGFSLMLLSIPVVALDGAYTSTKYEVYGVFVACVAVQGLMGLLPSHYLNKVQTAATWLNLFLVFLLCIALPIGAAHRKILNSGHWVFTDTTNLYAGYSYGGAFIFSFMAAIWTIGAFDSCIHLSEEASNASTAVPTGIILSIVLCGVLGFASQSIIAACIKGKDITAAMSTSFGQPLAQIIYDSLGKKWTVAIMTLIALASLVMGSSILTAASRQTYAVARDGILPFSRYLAHVNLNTAVPARAVLFDCVIGLLLGMLTMIDATAANALFSLAASSNSLAWVLPVFFRFFFPGAAEFKPGPFNLGDKVSKVIDGITILWLSFIILVLTVLPQTVPVDKNTMNYTCVVNPIVWLGSLVYYFVDAHKWYVGPKKTYSPDVEVLRGDSFESSASPHEKKAHTAVVDASSAGSV